MMNPLRAAAVLAAGLLVFVLAFDSAAPRAEEGGMVPGGPSDVDRNEMDDVPDSVRIQRWADALTSEIESVRKKTRERLAPQGAGGSQLLNSLMTNGDPRVRKVALELAWGRKDLGILAPGLTALLRDPDLGNRWNAAHLLGKTGEAAGKGGALELVRSMLDPSLRNQVPATWAVAELGPVSQDALVSTLREPSVLLAARPFRKLSGPGIVIQGGDACAENALVFALHSSPEAPIRRQAARVMKRLRLLGQKEEAELMRAALGDDSADVRIAAAAALAETPDERHAAIVHALREGRHDADLKARAAIVEALRKLGAGEEELK